ncbi:Na+/H+ antiporter subunit D [Echinicola jeungdonensis]|uniref:Na+/H+ antiporter subunit D n=1 Tax=Echinicola jeungdonensis TaxID=709343 RepID=A0ABV5J207_9BACT|nr:Na+/H+ antiporter subunit D [Echinicola jeungdonensis]MDN3671066.1 Na+/H+ antiporter subunit D [Echinicola jeungdonensis]
MVLFNPILILILAAILCMLFWVKPQIQKIITISAIFLFFASAVRLTYLVTTEGIQTVQAGEWPSPFGITFVADTFSALMVLVTSLVSVACIIYALENIDKSRKAKGFYPIFLFMIFGVTGAFLTGDVFNLYVWFEVMLVSSFVLISLGSGKAQLEGSVKYVILNFLASCFFLVGVGLLYKITGTLNMAALSVKIKEVEEPGMITLSALFFFLSFGIKAALFPLFFWLPASYHTPPLAISGLMAGLLTKVGVYAMIRFFTLIFTHDTAFTHQLLLIVAGLTMLVGVLGAIAHNDFRKILSFHIISQIGYMIMGLALFTPLALAGAIFYIIHHIIVKTNLFLISGLTKSINGSFQIKSNGGIYDYFPLISVLFVVAAFSLAGIPPLSGFWAKFILVKAGMEIHQEVIVGISLLVGLLTLFSMTKIWTAVFWAKGTKKLEMLVSSENHFQNSFLKEKYLMIIPVIFLAMITLWIGFFPNLLLDLAIQASDQLIQPDDYINAVLKRN